MTVILSEKTELALLQLRGAGDLTRWQTARMLLACVHDSRKNNPGAAQSEIYAALAARSGNAAHTVRAYCAVARRWSEEVTAEYDHLPLTFEHFRYAPERKWLDWCLENGDEHGGLPAPVDVMRAQIAQANGGAPLDFDKYKARALSALHGMLRLSRGKLREAVRVIAAQVEELGQ